MNPVIYQFIHVLCAILLVASTFYIAANPQKHTKKKMMMITGTLSLLMLVAGSALVTKLYGSLPAGGWTQGWVIGKIVCWLGVSAMSGMAYRKTKSFVLSATIGLAAVAVYLVYLRPF